MEGFGSLTGDLDGREVVTIAFEDSPCKTGFFINLSNFLTRELKMQVHYIDLDLQFSAYLRGSHTSVVTDLRNNELLKLYQPEDWNPEESFFNVLTDRGMIENGIIVVDTINTLQNLLRQKEHDSSNSMHANQKSAILVTLLQQTARRYSKSVWISSMLRSKPKESPGGEITWEKDLPGGRVMIAKSNAILSLGGGSSNPADLRENSNLIEREKVTGERLNCITLVPIENARGLGADAQEKKWSPLKSMYVFCV